MKRPYHVKVLLREIEKRKQKNSRYSLRAFASFLGVAPSTMSRILTNGQELSVEGTKKIMKKLNLNEEERILFIASVAEEKKLRTLKTLGKIPGDGSNKEFRFTLESIADIAMRHLSDGCIIHLKDPKDESILHAKHKYGQYDNGHRFDTLSAPVVCHPVLSPDRPLIINQGQHDDILGHLNAHSILCVPVLKGEKKLGAITLLRTNGREKFQDHDVPFALELSAKAVYIYNMLTEM